MVRRSHRDGLGSTSQAPRDRASGTNGVTDIPVVGRRGGTQRPGLGIVTAWPVTAGLGAQRNTRLIPPRAGGIRHEACDSLACDDLERGLEYTSVTWFHEWPGGVLLGNPLLPAGKREGGKLFFQNTLLWKKSSSFNHYQIPILLVIWPDSAETAEREHNISFCY